MHAVFFYRSSGFRLDHRPRHRPGRRARDSPVAGRPVSGSHPAARGHIDGLSGASSENIDSDVASIIEESLDGATGLRFYETTSDDEGNLEIDVTFSAGTNPDIALIDVQNRLKQVEPRLPQPVVQQGISVSRASGSFLMLVALASTDGQRDSVEVKRLSGTSRAARTEAGAWRGGRRNSGMRRRRCVSGSIPSSCVNTT